MTTHNIAQVRCIEKTEPGCKRAVGYTFLQLDWLPWTTVHCCRKCAEVLHPELIQTVEKGAYRQPSDLIAD